MALPLLWVSLAFLSGIVLDRFLRASLEIWLIVALTPILAALILRRRIPNLASLNIGMISAVSI
ncbi:MAG TPA: hypothetical protein VIN60_02680, partial [Anaerolineales bacterium]